MKFARELHERIRREFPEVSIFHDRCCPCVHMYALCSYVSINSGTKQSVSSE
jgi:hypothetical protein